jgi:hypothetical protein
VLICIPFAVPSIAIDKALICDQLSRIVIAIGIKLTCDPWILPETRLL